MSNEKLPPNEQWFRDSLHAAAAERSKTERAELIEKPSLEVAARKALAALEGLIEHGNAAPWKAWENALNANVALRQALLLSDATPNPQKQEARK